MILRGHKLLSKNNDPEIPASIMWIWFGVGISIIFLCVGLIVGYLK
jgi:hypothetical protein